MRPRATISRASTARCRGPFSAIGAPRSSQAATGPSTPKVTRTRSPYCAAHRLLIRPPQTSAMTTIPGFEYRDVPVGGGVTLHTAIGGSGSPVVLLHGFPQTHLMWRHVAADLAGQHTVIAPDLRGYGASAKPAEDGPDTYAKRTM